MGYTFSSFDLIFPFFFCRLKCVLKILKPQRKKLLTSGTLRANRKLGMWTEYRGICFRWRLLCFYWCTGYIMEPSLRHQAADGIANFKIQFTIQQTIVRLDCLLFILAFTRRHRSVDCCKTKTM